MPSQRVVRGEIAGRRKRANWRARNSAKAPATANSLREQRHRRRAQHERKSSPRRASALPRCGVFETARRRSAAPPLRPHSAPLSPRLTFTKICMATEPVTGQHAHDRDEAASRASEDPRNGKARSHDTEQRRRSWKRTARSALDSSRTSQDRASRRAALSGRRAPVPSQRASSWTTQTARAARASSKRLAVQSLQRRRTQSCRCFSRSCKKRWRVDAAVSRIT